jgi:hypothetical protein
MAAAWIHTEHRKLGVFQMTFCIDGVGTIAFDVRLLKDTVCGIVEEIKRTFNDLPRQTVQNWEKILKEKFPKKVGRFYVY